MQMLIAAQTKMIYSLIEDKFLLNIGEFFKTRLDVQIIF